MRAIVEPRTHVEDAFRQSSTGLALLGLDARWLEVNPAATVLLGRRREALVGRSVQGLCTLTEGVVLAQHIESVVDGDTQAFCMDLRLPRLDGSHSWLRLDASAVPDTAGYPAHLAIAITDVADERRAREERDAFFDLCPDPLAIATADGYILRVNPAWETALGWTSEDMRAQPFLDFVHPDDREHTAVESRRSFEGHSTPCFRNRYRRRDGGYRWLEWHSRPGDDGRIYCIARDVTEQQHASLAFEAEMARRLKALDAAEQRLGVHVNNTPLAVVEFDARLRVQRWSSRAHGLFGWAEDEVIGKRPDQWRFIHEHDADGVATAMLSLVTGESPSLVIDNRNYTRDGDVLHCEWFMSAVFDEAGHLLSVLAFAQDVSARVAAQAEAEDREAMFRATFQQAPVGIAHVALDGRWLRVNETLCTFLGHSADDLLAGTFQDITHPEDLQSDLAFVQRLLERRIDRYDMRKRYLHRDGHVLWAHLTVSLRLDAAGQPLHFISIVEDIGATIAGEQALQLAHEQLESRVAERTRELERANRTLAVEIEQRREAEVALRESELRMRGILENSYDAFVACDDQGKVVEWNRSAEAIFGWRRSEVLGRPLTELIIPPSMRARHEARIARYLADGGRTMLEQRLQLRARHRKGHEFPVELTISQVRLGNRQLFTAFLHDISERAAADRQLRESESRLRTITDNVPALIAYVDRNLRYHFANATYQTWFGYAPGDLQDKRIPDVIGAKAYEYVKPYIEQVLRGERASFDIHFPMSTGGLRHAHAEYIPDIDDRGVVQGFYVTAHDITAHKQLAHVMEQRALRDDLTGLPNRAAWTQELDNGLARTERDGRGAAVMFLDLDDFKRVNDEHGHEAGDAVLREFAARLRASVREGDVVARLAGDEFVVLLQSIDEPAQAAAVVAQAIVAAMAPPFAIHGGSVPMATSIGIAAQAHGLFDRENLLRRADEAMYRAKRTEGSTFDVVEIEANATHVLRTPPPTSTR